MGRRHPAWRYALLALSLTVVALVAFHPHWNVASGERRELTTHMDAYVHWGRAKAALDQGTVAYAEPFAPAGSQQDFDLRASLHERGYHAYLAALKDATGLDWLTLWEYIPLTMALLLALTVFALAERWGAGAEAALWVAAIPTSLRFLGPAFMAPMAFALPLFVAGIIALFRLERGPKVLALFVIICGLWPIHTMPALALSALAATDGLIRLRRAIMPSLAQLGGVAVPILVVAPYIEYFLESRPGSQELPAEIETVRMAGLAFFLAAALGAALLAARRATAHAALVLAPPIIYLGALAIERVRTGNDVLAIYDRSLMIIYVLCAMLGGVAVARLPRVLVRGSRGAAPGGALALASILLLSGQMVAVAGAAAPQFGQPYYEVLSPSRYEAYVAAARVLNETHRVALVDDSSGMAFSILTGRPLHFTFYPSSQGVAPSVSAFTAAGSRDTRFLVENGITVVVTLQTVENPDLRQVAEGVYVLRHDYAARIAAAQLAQLERSRN
ncbi:MAG TPA: hypothetical protein VFH78_13425 [Candidatus Thermoplasmatota archaeon]|nr:hypothetical protein [Candidatus Thermoplasmatota archaeon]